MNILKIGLGIFLVAVGVDLTIEGCKTIKGAFTTKKN